MRPITPSPYYIATIDKFGQRNAHGKDLKPAKRGKKRLRLGNIINTVMLIDIVNADGELMSDHMWLDAGEEFRGFRIGDKIKFTGIPSKYIKGCYLPNFKSGKELVVDYRINDIKNIELLSRDA